MMQLTIALALVCFFQTVLCAPAVNQKQAAKEEDTLKPIPSDTLELELQGVPLNQPIQTHYKNEGENAPVREEPRSNNNGGPEVKRSERVDTDNEPMNDVEDNLSDLSGNMKAADQDVKAVLRTFFQNLKKHPEIVEDIIEREGAKLMDRPLEEGEVEGEDGEDLRDGVVPVDISDFQKPSPQLIKIPKQVEKKTGAFPEYPRFIYKSPMRNMKERNQLTAASQNSQQHPPTSIHNNVMNAHNVVVDDGSDVKTPDLSNAIPVIQQPSSNQEEEEKQVNELLSNPEEGGAIDLTTLQRAQEEYSEAHPFMNTLPLFPGDNKDSEDIVKPKLESQDSEDIVKPKLESQDSEERSDEIAESSAQDKEIVNTNTGIEESEEEAEEKRSDISAESHETKDDKGEDDKWSETEVGEKSEETVPHQITGEEIAAETLNNPVESESSVTFRPYSSYYYYYNEDGEKEDGGELDATEEGESEDSNENELKKISSESANDEEEEETEEEHYEDEKQDEDENEETEEKDDEEAEEEADDSDETEGVVEGGDSEDDESEHEETEADESEGEHSENHAEGHEDADAEHKTNSKNVETVVISHSEIPDTPRLFKSKGLMVDKNEADLMSLHGDKVRPVANQPLAGQPM